MQSYAGGYGGAAPPPPGTTFLSIDPLNTSNLASAKSSSYYCLTPASSTTSLNDLNHSLSVNLHLNSSSNESLATNVSLNKKPKTSSSSTTTTNKSTRTRASKASRTSFCEPPPPQTIIASESLSSSSLSSFSSLSSLNSTTSVIEPVKRKRGRPRKTPAPEPTPPPSTRLTLPTLMYSCNPPNLHFDPMLQSAAIDQSRVFATVNNKHSHNSNLQRQKSQKSSYEVVNTTISVGGDPTMNYMLAIQAHSHASATSVYGPSPLPHLSWTNSADLWHVMKRKESEEYRHDWRYMSVTHVDVEPRMRAILLDWVVEIAHAYRLHRETFHLAVEYFDRFMTLNKQKVSVDR